MKKYYATLVESDTHGHAGKWAVGSGNKNAKYYLTTVCDTETEAKSKVIRWTMLDAMRKTRRKTSTIKP
jgi:hypothetical protein